MRDKVWQFEEQNGFLVSETVKLKQNILYVVCPYGIGDTLYVASLIEDLKKRRHIQHKICLIVKQGHSQIPDWFGAVDEKIVSDKMVKALNEFSILTGTWELNNYLYGHFRKNKRGELLPEYTECEVKNMVYRYKKLVFHLPVDCQIKKPDIIFRRDLLEFVIKKYEIGKQTIILMPYAYSMELASEDFWETLAEILIKYGYQVFTNTKDNKEFPIKGTKRLCADIATMAMLCEKCKLVISLRNGLCDVLAFTNTKLVVLNSSEYQKNEWNLQTVTERKGIYNIFENNYLKTIFLITKILITENNT